MKLDGYSTYSRSALWVIGGIALCLLLYSLARAINVCFTTDEAFSYIVYVKQNVFYLHDFDGMSANFHMLNTWGMIACDRLFGNSEWSLRIPNIIGHILYLYFTARFSLRSKSTWNAATIFILLNAQPYVLDFFSVARGYGLSFGLTAGS